MHRRALAAILVAVLAAAALPWALRRSLGPRRQPGNGLADVRSLISRLTAPDEEEARRIFLRTRPGERPLNWRIGETALDFHRRRPMKPFVLNRNDCSDYVACIVDEALGARPRIDYERGRHTFWGRDLWAGFYWQPGMPVQLGDIVDVVHSPWYEPREGVLSHVGVLGSDGRVYDFVKLRHWTKHRYGRHTFDEFVYNSLGPREITVFRLKPEYRYRLRAVSSAPALPVPEEQGKGAPKEHADRGDPTKAPDH
jgi:hypothetical protein